MRRKRPPVEHFPPHLERFVDADWVDRFAWAEARWEWYRAHPELHDVVDPIELLRERRSARLETP